MNEETSSEVEAAGLRQIVVDIWNTLVGRPATVVEVTALELAGRPLLCGHIEVLGQWRGRITVTATAGMATGIASAMFDKAAVDVTESDRRDAIGELTNVIGGNFKALLTPLESRLSLPSVAPGPALPQASGERQLGEVALLCDGQALLVSFVAGS